MIAIFFFHLHPASLSHFFNALISSPLAKQKLEDRLAAAAREKLAQASKESKEKQLQAERKRKAALFLQNLRGPLTGEPEAKRVELDPSAQLEVGDWSIKVCHHKVFAQLLTIQELFCFSY